MEITINSAVIAKGVFGIQVGYKENKLFLEMKDSKSAENLEADLILNKIDYTGLYLNDKRVYILDYKSVKVHKNHRDYVCNTIVTRPVKTTWTKEEVIEFICNKFDTYYMNYVTAHNHNRYPLHYEIERWLEKNLQ